MIKNDLSLRFCIWDFDDKSETEISEALDLIPYKTYIKGKRINLNSPKISKRNGWIYGEPYGNGDDFEKQLNKLLDILEPKIYILKEYSRIYTCEFSCALFLNNKEEDIPWIHFDKRYNAFIREVDAEFDFDIYTPSLNEE